MLFRCSPALIVFLALVSPGKSQDTFQMVSLDVPAGAPLRVYLTKRISKRLGEPVQAKLLDPLYSFDREVAPAGSQVLGSVVRLKPVSRSARAAAILAGDFTPLHQADVEFTTLVLPDGRRMPLHTIGTPGLDSLADLNPKKKHAAPNTGVMGTAKAQARDRIDAARRSVSDAVRAPDKKERLEDYLWTKLPYHPQRVRRLTRFDAELAEPLSFGTAKLNDGDLHELGSQPPSDSSAQARIVTPMSSGESKQGERVEAVLTRPLFSSDHKLLLPEGTGLQGAVTMVHRARWFHRGGQLRFNFEQINLPAGIARPQIADRSPHFKTLAMLQAAEPDGKAIVKVDQEGGVKATESKTRFLAPVLAAFIANHAADEDVSKRTGLPETNNSGRTLGGASGFGLFGVAAAKASPTMARAFGYYGLAWSVFSNVIAHGKEVRFNRNAAVDLRFGARTPAPPATRFVPTAPEKDE